MTLGRPSRRTTLTLLVVAVVSLLFDVVFGAFRIVRTDDDANFQATDTVSLPAPNRDGDVSVERAIANRRSRREYGADPLTQRELGQLLWATQGITDAQSGFRAAPSAGALYPLEVYVVVGTPGVEGIDPDVYRYSPEGHELAAGDAGDVQQELQRAALDQEFVGDAAIDIVVCAVDERTTAKYGPRGERRYVPMEVGHAGENVYLQAEALGLATVSVGAFNDDRVRDIVGAPSNQRPLYVVPIGRQR
jgi:SagB-type dehydrogenase family enzyme